MGVCFYRYEIFFDLANRKDEINTTRAEIFVPALVV